MDFKFTDKQDPTAPEEKIAVVFSGSYEDTPENAEIWIEEGIVEIAENAFRDFQNLRAIHFPKRLKIVSACAFAGCKSLVSVDMNFGLEEILDEAFKL